MASGPPGKRRPVNLASPYAPFFSPFGVGLVLSPVLEDTELIRYGRQIALEQVGESGQLRLKKSSVAIVGVGGLGSPAALFLAAAGLGELHLIDGDLIESGNLPRQILYGEADIGHPKGAAAQARLSTHRSDLRLVVHPEMLSLRNAPSFLRHCDLVLDCSDNFATRYLCNQVAWDMGRPVLGGAVQLYEGRVWRTSPQTACYACMFPFRPDERMVSRCDTVGILGSMTGMIGTLMAHEALKYLLEIPSPLQESLLVFDSKSLYTTLLKTKKDPHCRVCGRGGTASRDPVPVVPVASVVSS